MQQNAVLKAQIETMLQDKSKQVEPSQVVALSNLNTNLKAKFKELQTNFDVFKNSQADIPKDARSSLT